MCYNDETIPFIQLQADKKFFLVLIEEQVLLFLHSKSAEVLSIDCRS